MGLVIAAYIPRSCNDTSWQGLYSLVSKPAAVLSFGYGYHSKKKKAIPYVSKSGLCLEKPFFPIYEKKPVFLSQIDFMRNIITMYCICAWNKI